MMAGQQITQIERYKNESARWQSQRANNAPDANDNVETSTVTVNAGYHPMALHPLAGPDHYLSCAGLW